MLELARRLLEAEGVATFLRAAILVAARLSPLTVVAPWLGLRAAPPIVRTAIVLGLTFAFAPLAVSQAASAPNDVPVAVLVLREALVGTLFAIASSLPFFAMDWAGRLVDTWRGASLAEVIAPPTGERTSPLGDAYLLFAVALFATLGGHRVALGAFARSLRSVPIGHLDAGHGVSALGLGAARLVASSLELAVAVAAPAAVVILLVDVSLGMIARMAPQIPVFFAGMPLRALAGVAACLISVPLLSNLLEGTLPSTIAAAERLLLPFAAP